MIHEVMLNYFLSLFTYDIGNADECLNTIKHVSSVNDNEILLAPFIEEGIKNAVFSMHSEKSPRPNGMNPTFYQRY